MKIEFYCGVAIRSHLASELARLRLWDPLGATTVWEPFTDGMMVRAVWWWNGGRKGQEIVAWSFEQGSSEVIFVKSICEGLQVVNNWLRNWEQGWDWKTRHCIVWDASTLKKWWNEGTKVEGDKINVAGRVFWGYKTLLLHCLRSIYLSFDRMMAQNQISCLGKASFCTRS